MPLRLSIDQLTPSTSPIGEAVTKFGGQPVWLSEPQWPISPRLGKPMRFVAQIQLDARIAGEILAGKVAYFFVTDETGDDGTYVGGGWPGDGESAVIIQPGVISEATTRPNATGPTLRDTRDHDLEFAVTLSEGNDPPYTTESEIYGWDNMDDPNAAWSDDRRDEYYNAVRGTKLGGTPSFFQGDQLPDRDDMVLLLQVETEQLGLNLGDAGAGYLFVSRDGARSTYIVQSC